MYCDADNFAGEQVVPLAASPFATLPPNTLPPVCNIASNDLHRRLAESINDAAAFDTAFITGSHPPRCRVCSRLIHEHAADAVIVGASDAAVFFGSTGEAQSPAIRSESKDVDVTEHTLHAGFAYIAAFLVLIALVLILVFCATG